MIYSYKVTCLFTPEWPLVYKSLFGDAVHCASEQSISIATFTFDSPQTPSDLGPLVRVELLSE